MFFEKIVCVQVLLFFLLKISKIVTIRSPDKQFLAECEIISVELTIGVVFIKVSRILPSRWTFLKTLILREKSDDKKCIIHLLQGDWDLGKFVYMTS